MIDRNKMIHTQVHFSAGGEPAYEFCKGLRADKQELSSLTPSLQTDDLDLALWESYGRILLSCNEFLYVE